MCDYSLATYDSRLAAAGETLVVTRFPSGTIGFASPGDAGQRLEPSRRPHWWVMLGVAPPAAPCAVCLPPGARLILRDIPERLQRRLGVGREEEVTFTQLTAEADVHRDAVVFSSQCATLLQDLEPGQVATVLALSSEEMRMVSLTGVSDHVE